METGVKGNEGKGTRQDGGGWVGRKRAEVYGELKGTEQDKAREDRGRKGRATCREGKGH